MSESSDRLRKFLQQKDAPKLLIQDIQTLLGENEDSERWRKLADYFKVNEIDMVLHLHAGTGLWTCMLWGPSSAYGEGETAFVAMERALLTLKRPT